MIVRGCVVEAIGRGGKRVQTFSHIESENLMYNMVIIYDNIILYD